MPQQLPLINMLIISCKQIKRFRSQILPPIHPGKKCVLPVHQNGGQKAVFANADVHLSTNKCRVSRNLRFPWEEKSRSVLIEPDALHPFRDTQKRREKKKSKDETKPSRKKHNVQKERNSEEQRRMQRPACPTTPSHFASPNIGGSRVERLPQCTHTYS